MTPLEYQELIRRVERLEELAGIDPEPSKGDASVAPVDAPAGPPATPPPLPEPAPSPQAPPIPGKPLFHAGEAWLGRIGALLLVLGFIFLLKLSFDRGWISAWVQVIGVALVSTGLVYLGDRRRHSGMGALVFAVGASGLYGAILAAFFLHNLLSASVALVLAVAVTLLSLVQSIRTSRQPLAVFSIGGGLLALFSFARVIEASTLALTFASLLLACAVALHVLRGWSGVVVLAACGNWLVLFLAAIGPTAELWLAWFSGQSHLTSLPVMTQAAIIWGWAWLHGGTLLRQLRVPEGSRAARVLFILASVLAPLFAVTASGLAWALETQTAFGWAYVAVGVAAAAAGLVLRRLAPATAAPQWLLAAAATAVGVVILWEGLVLLVALTLLALLVHYTWGATGGRTMAAGGILVGLLLAAVIVFEAALWNRETSLWNLMTAAGAVIAVPFCGLLTRQHGALVIYRVAAYALAAMLVASAADTFDLGFPLTAAVWSLLALGLFRCLPGARDPASPMLGLLVYAGSSVILVMAYISDGTGGMADGPNLLAGFIGLLAATGFYFTRVEEEIQRARLVALWFGGGVVVATAWYLLAPFQNGVLVSPAWAVLAALLMTYGARKASAQARAGSIVVLITLLARLFLVDLADLDPVWRTVVFIFTGALLLGLGLALSRKKG